MSKDEPFISVLIPSYNHEQYVEQTIRSIWLQPYKCLEIIVIDDCSTDNSVALLRQLQAESPCKMEVLVNGKQSGPAATINHAINRSNGELLALIASDDLYVEDPFTKRVKMFKQDPSLQIVYGNGLSFDKHGIRGKVHREEVKKILSLSAPEILEYLFTHTSPIFLQSALIRKELILKAGYCDDSLKADDWLINTRMFQELARSGAGFAYYDEPVFLYRAHENNLHKNVSRQIELKLEFINKVTPEHLRSIAKFNILYGLSIMAIKDGQMSVGIDLFRQSRQGGSDLRRTVRFTSKLLGSILTTRKRKNPQKLSDQ